MIQPAGPGGTPSAGQRWTATANASWTASSARSMSPRTRTSTDTARPYSARKTASTSVMRSSSSDGPDLDRQPEDAGQPASPVQCGVEVLGLDHGEPADVFLTLDVRAVGHQHRAAVALLEYGRGAGRVQARVEHPGSGGSEVVVPAGQIAHDRVQYVRSRRRPVRLIDGQHVARHEASFLSPSVRTPPRQIDKAQASGQLLNSALRAW